MKQFWTTASVLLALFLFWKPDSASDLIDKPENSSQQLELVLSRFEYADQEFRRSTSMHELRKNEELLGRMFEQLKALEAIEDATNSGDRARIRTLRGTLANRFRNRLIAFIDDVQIMNLQNEFENAMIWLET